MANQEHLDLLMQQGVDVWNRWIHERIKAVEEQRGSTLIIHMSSFKADLSGADLSGVDLSNARLDNAHLENARLDNARLNGASLSHAGLNEAQLKNANLSG